MLEYPALLTFRFLANFVRRLLAWLPLQPIWSLHTCL
jgi:hypothetical protein